MKIKNLYWFTGQPGAGKTTLAQSLKTYLKPITLKKIIILDGDNIRDIFKNQDYSKEGRLKNVDLVQSCCKFLIENDIIVIVCMVSPFRDQRYDFCKQMNGIEIYVHCSEKRGREHFFVDYFEQPSPFMHSDSIAIDTTLLSPEESFSNLLNLLGDVK
jgi:adenylylsulfate kinase-like enzyme